MQITDNAINKVAEMKSPNENLRVYITGGGCPKITILIINVTLIDYKNLTPLKKYLMHLTSPIFRVCL